MEFHTTLPFGPLVFFLSLSFAALAFPVWRMFVTLCLTPLRVKWAFEAQGLKGLPYRFFYGNAPDYVALGQQARSLPMRELSHDIAPRLMPQYFFWSKKFGNPFFFFLGPQPITYVVEPYHAREMLSNKFGHFGKLEGRPDTTDLLGKGLVSIEGEKWAQHRRILSPAFYVDKLKAMTPTMAACTASLLDSWDAQIDQEASGFKEIDVHKEMRGLTADIIAHTAFGSSYIEGKRVFEIQHEQQILFIKVLRTVYIPGSRFLPTSMNRYRWKMDGEIQKILRKLIHSRMELAKAGHDMCSDENDLLGLMMASNKRQLQGNQKNLMMDIGEIVDECKTFFFAGHETTSTLLTWTLMLLGADQEWQDRARNEVVSVCGKDPPTAESLNNLKIVGMVLNESLRLYPPATLVMRKAHKDMKLGSNLVIPKGAATMVPIIAFHHDPKYWGPDVHQFNPQRFANGIAKAGMNPMAFMPFGLGPRNCIGQTFALLESKIALSLILQRFSFRVSSTYVHAPTFALTLQPEYGVQINFQKLAT